MTEPSPRLDFDPVTLPPLDRQDGAERVRQRLAQGEISETDAERLLHFREHGWVAFPKLLGEAEVDALAAEHEAAWNEGWPVQALVEGRGVVSVPDLPARSELGTHHYRLNDIQDTSETVRRTLLHPELMRFLRLYFDQPPVAMQTLFFEYGSEQGTHQDFPYVQAAILSHLVGCWIACEDVDENNGPLFYYPGSHRMGKFDWGGGSLTFDGKDESKVEAFGEFLEKEAAASGLERQVFHARRGDVFLWHGGLVHGGSPAHDPGATRLSLVAHFSTRLGYPRDRRYPQVEPSLYEREGGYVYLPPERLPSDSLLGRAKGLAKRILGR